MLDNTKNKNAHHGLKGTTLEYLGYEPQENGEEQETGSKSISEKLGSLGYQIVNYQDPCKDPEKLSLEKLIELSLKDSGHNNISDLERDLNKNMYFTNADCVSEIQDLFSSTNSNIGPYYEKHHVLLSYYKKMRNRGEKALVSYEKASKQYKKCLKGEAYRTRKMTSLLKRRLKQGRNIYDLMDRYHRSINMYRNLDGNLIPSQELATVKIGYEPCIDADIDSHTTHDLWVEEERRRKEEENQISYRDLYAKFGRYWYWDEKSQYLKRKKLQREIRFLLYGHAIVKADSLHELKEIGNRISVVVKNSKDRIKRKEISEISLTRKQISSLRYEYRRKLDEIMCPTNKPERD